jgi:hypothetical protein
MSITRSFSPPQVVSTISLVLISRNCGGWGVAQVVEYLTYKLKKLWKLPLLSMNNSIIIYMDFVNSASVNLTHIHAQIYLNIDLKLYTG